MHQLLGILQQHDRTSASQACDLARGEKGRRCHQLCIPAEGVLDGVLPFVNGVLLGYPFVYCVSAETVNRACAWLSTTELLLCGCGPGL